MWPKFKLNQALIVLVTRKNEEDPFKNEREWSQQFSECKSRHSRGANSAVTGWILPNFEFIRDLTVVLINCKNKEDKIAIDPLGSEIFMFESVTDGHKLLNHTS